MKKLILYKKNLYHYINQVLQTKMPVWGLVISSITFSIPAYVAYKRKKKHMSKCCSLLTLSSVLYHGTNNIIVKTIDVLYAHFLGFSYSVMSISNFIKQRRIYDFVLMTGSLGTVYIFIGKVSDINNKYVNRWHMGMHYLSQGLWTLHALDNKK